MDDKFPQLNLEEFAHGYQSYYEATCHLMTEAERTGVLTYILTKDINSQYKYSDHGRKGYPIMSFLKERYLTGEKEIFLSFFNEILPNIIMYLNSQDWEIDSINRELRPVVNKFGGLIVQSNNSKVFNVDFYYDNKSKDFKRKLDKVAVETINFNDANLEGDNKDRYQECVSDFLSYNRELIKSNRLFYNESLDRLKRVIENTLQNKYKRTDGGFPMIHNKKELSNILFDGSNTDFENLVSYVVKNVHHEEGGTPKNFNEKEYVYLWLELNKILYLLNRYKK